MGKFKRFCLLVFACAGLINTLLLATIWFAWDPLMPFAAWLMLQPWFGIVEMVLLALMGIGFVAMLIYGIAAQGTKGQLSTTQENGTITITRKALETTVRRVIERHHGLNAQNITVSIRGKKDARIRIKAKVDSGAQGNLYALGDTLQREIITTVEAFSGHYVEKANITFTGDSYKHEQLEGGTHERINTTAHYQKPQNSFAAQSAPV